MLTYRQYLPIAKSTMIVFMILLVIGVIGFLALQAVDSTRLVNPSERYLLQNRVALCDEALKYAKVRVDASQYEVVNCETFVTDDSEPSVTTTLLLYAYPNEKRDFFSKRAYELEIVWQPFRATHFNTNGSIKIDDISYRSLSWGSWN